MTTAKGSWKETVEGIQNAVQSQIYVSTNTTLSKHNAADFLTTIDYIKELGVDAFGCNSLIYSGKAPAASKEFALTIDELKTLLPKIRDKAQHTRPQVPLVHANTVLQLRPRPTRLRRQKLHSRNDQRLRRTQRRRLPLPKLL